MKIVQIAREKLQTTLSTPTYTVPVGKVTNLSNISLYNKGQKAEHVGTAALPGGFDWGASNQDFKIKVNQGNVLQIVLDQTVTSIIAAVNLINLKIREVSNDFDANIFENGSFVIEAFDDGNSHVGFRSTKPGAYVFELIVGTTNALATMGMTAGIYQGIDLVYIDVYHLEDGETESTAPPILLDHPLAAGEWFGISPRYTMHAGAVLKAKASRNDFVSFNSDGLEQDVVV